MLCIYIYIYKFFYKYFDRTCQYSSCEYKLRDGSGECRGKQSEETKETPCHADLSGRVLRAESAHHRGCGQPEVDTVIG